MREIGDWHALIIYRFGIHTVIVEMSSDTKVVFSHILQYNEWRPYHELVPSLLIISREFDVLVILCCFGLGFALERKRYVEKLKLNVVNFPWVILCISWYIILSVANWDTGRYQERMLNVFWTACFYIKSCHFLRFNKNTLTEANVIYYNQPSFH